MDISQKRILVIEDDPQLRLLINTLLSEEGYHVTSAKNGVDGLNQINTNTFEAIISDYSLPYYDGLELLKVTRTRHPATPFIILTSHIACIEDKAGKLGCSLVLDKPFDVSRFLDAVDNLVNH